MSKPKLALKRINIDLSEIEHAKLQTYCQLTGRTATDVLRESVRKLKLPAIASR